MATHALDTYFDELLSPATVAPSPPAPSRPVIAVDVPAAAPPAPTPPSPAITPQGADGLSAGIRKRGEELRRRIAARRKAEEVAAAAKVGEKSSRWLRFQLSGQSYAVELLKVQEVQRVPDIMPVRGAPSHMLGIMNLRGQIISVVDLSQCLGLPGDALTDAARIIVIESKNETIGLRVSSVAEVIAVRESAVENPVGAIPALPREALIGIARHPGGMSVLLEATAFLA